MSVKNRLANRLGGGPVVKAEPVKVVSPKKEVIVIDEDDD